MLVERVEYAEIKINGRVVRIESPRVQTLTDRDGRTVYVITGAGK